GAGAYGGGVAVYAGYTGSILSQSSIIAGNSASTKKDISHSNSVVMVNCAYSDAAGFVLAPGSAANKLDTMANFNLSPLQDNGGRLLPDGNRIKSQIPISPSTLIDAGVNVFSQGLDTRGYPRTTGASL